MCISIVLGKVLNNWMLSIKICGSIGLVCLGLAGINGGFIIKDRLKTKNKINNFAIIVGSTNTSLAVIIFLIINKN